MADASNCPLAYLHVQLGKVRVDVGTITAQKLERMWMAVLNTLGNVNNNNLALVVAAMIYQQKRGERERRGRERNRKCCVSGGESRRE